MNNLISQDGLVWTRKDLIQFEIWETTIDGYVCGAIRKGKTWEVYTGCYVHFVDGSSNFTVDFNAVEPSVQSDHFSHTARRLLKRCLDEASRAFPLGEVSYRHERTILPK